MKPPAFFTRRAGFWQWFSLGYFIGGCISLPPVAAYLIYLLLD